MERDVPCIVFVTLNEVLEQANFYFYSTFPQKGALHKPEFISATLKIIEAEKIGTSLDSPGQVNDCSGMPSSNPQSLAP